MNLLAAPTSDPKPPSKADLLRRVLFEGDYELKKGWTRPPGGRNRVIGRGVPFVNMNDIATAVGVADDQVMTQQREKTRQSGTLYRQATVRVLLSQAVKDDGRTAGSLPAMLAALIKRAAFERLTTKSWLRFVGDLDSTLSSKAVRKRPAYNVFLSYAHDRGRIERTLEKAECILLFYDSFETTARSTFMSALVEGALNKSKQYVVVTDCEYKGHEVYRSLSMLLESTMPHLRGATDWPNFFSKRVRLEVEPEAARRYGNCVFVANNSGRGTCIVLEVIDAMHRWDDRHVRDLHHWVSYKRSSWRSGPGTVSERTLPRAAYSSIAYHHNRPTANSAEAQEKNTFYEALLEDTTMGQTKDSRMQLIECGEIQFRTMRLPEYGPPPNMVKLDKGGTLRSHFINAQWNQLDDDESHGIPYVVRGGVRHNEHLLCKKHPGASGQSGGERSVSWSYDTAGERG